MARLHTLRLALLCTAAELLPRTLFVLPPWHLPTGVACFPHTHSTHRNFCSSSLLLPLLLTRLQLTRLAVAACSLEELPPGPYLHNLQELVLFANNLRCCFLSELCDERARMFPHMGDDAWRLAMLWGP